MKIAFCLPDVDWLRQLKNEKPTEAARIQQAYIFEGLRARGHQVCCFSPLNLRDVVYSSDGQPPAFAARTWSRSHLFEFFRKSAWVIQRRLGIPYLNYFSNYSFLDAYLHSLRGYDLIYERIPFWSCGAAMACKRLKIPYVLFFDADQIAESDYLGKKLTGALRWRAGQILRSNLRTAQRVICVSEQAKTNLITKWGVPGEKIVVFKNGVDVNLFRPQPKERMPVCADLGISLGSPVCLFVGSFYAWHDVATLLEAFSRVLIQVPQARLVLVGDGANRQSMLQKAAELGIDHAVCFTGLVPHAEVFRYIAAADVAVVPYPKIQQGLWLSPMKLFEFMASGAAIVATALGQVAEVIQDGQNGLLVPPGDAEKMAAAILRLITDDDLRRRLSQQARADAVSQYSWELYIDRLESLLNSIWSEPAG